MERTELEFTASKVKKLAGMSGAVSSVELTERRGEKGGSFEIKFDSGKTGVASAADKGRISFGMLSSTDR